MSEHKCDHFCQEYGCEQFKEKPYNDLSKGTINTNPKPKGECPVSSFSAGVNHKEPMPKKNDSKPIWDMVIEDMKERDSVGEERYGTRLQKFNGRNSAVDAYQEGLDLVVYLRQLIEERKETVEVLKEVLDSNAPMEMTDELYWKIENILKEINKK